MSKEKDSLLFDDPEWTDKILSYIYEKSTFFFLLASVAVMIACWYFYADSYERYLFSEYLEAKIKVTLHADSAGQFVMDSKEKYVLMRGIELINHPITIATLKRCKVALIKSFITTFIIMSCVVFYFRKNKKLMTWHKS